MPTQYQDIPKAIGEIKRPMWAMILIGIIFQIITIQIALNASAPKSTKTYTPLQTCYYGMRSMFHNNPNSNLLHGSIVDAVKEKSFNINKITLIKVVNDFSCDVIARDNKGFRSYRVMLEKNSKFAHFYRIHDIKEQNLKSPYQWRTK